MNHQYSEHVSQRASQAIPPLPLSASQVDELCKKLLDDTEKQSYLVDLLVTRVPAGVAEAAKAKADFLASIVMNDIKCSAISPEYAIEILATMVGGYNVKYLVDFLSHTKYAAQAAKAFKKLILIFDSFDDIKALMDNGNEYAKEVITSWAEAEWFLSRPQMPETIEKIVYKVDGVVNNDDLSPPKHVATRADIPLHSLTMGEDKFPGGINIMQKNRDSGEGTVFVGDTVGIGSSRKSAVNSLIWAIGEDIPYIPNKRSGGVVIAGSIAPVFFNTLVDSGGLPVLCDVSKIENGAKIIIDTQKSEVRNINGKLLSQFLLSPITLPDAYRAGGRIPLIIGRKLTQKAREVLGMEKENIFIKHENVQAKDGKGFTLAQKIIGRACGKSGVLPGETCEPKVSTVGSQDATGVMTCDELTELACLKFQASLTIQSFCHTAAYPNENDIVMHNTLPEYFKTRGGVALKPGDGIIHSWLNRMLIPDQVGIGGDSHMHSPLGISFPAGSGLVAFAATLGMMPLDVPESLLLRLNGKLRNGIVLRDVVNYIAMKGAEHSGKKSIFNGKILEMEGFTSELTVEQAFELTASVAERSGAGCTIDLAQEKVVEYLESNVTIMQSIINDGYECKDAITNRLEEIRKWLIEPNLLRRDVNADFSDELEIDLAEIEEPVIAAPNDPNNTCWLSEHKGVEIDEVFIGSCMTNINHFRAAARVLAGKKIGVNKLWIVPPTRMDMKSLRADGIIRIFENAGARIEIPGCSLCMGNQARSEENATVFSTSTKNTNNRMGTGAKMYLGSAELAAIVALLGTIPTAEQYFRIYNQEILGVR